MTLHGTRPTSAGPDHGRGHPPHRSTIGYQGGNPMWPGITWGHDAQCSCTWAHSGGVYQVKVRDAACTTHGGFWAVARG